MAKFHYIVSATTGDNVGSIDAKDEAEAKQKLNDIYTPNEQMQKSSAISFKLIEKDKHDSEKKRIDAARLAEANETPSV